MKYQTYQTFSVFLLLLVQLFTNGSVVDHGVVSFYISECYWALLFNSCPHCMYIFQNKMRCIYESFRSNYGTVSPTTWWELKYFCSIKFLKNTKMECVEVCDCEVLVPETSGTATFILRLWILKLMKHGHLKISLIPGSSNICIGGFNEFKWKWLNCQMAKQTV